jgi:hypothetical protein
VVYLHHGRWRSRAGGGEEEGQHLPSTSDTKKMSSDSRDNDFTLREYDKSTGGRSASSLLLSKGGKWGFLVGDNGGGDRKREGGPSFDVEFFLLPPSHVELSYARRSWFSLRCNLTWKNFRFRCIYRVWSDLRLKLATTRTLLSIQSRDFCLHR